MDQNNCKASSDGQNIFKIIVKQLVIVYIPLMQKYSAYKNNKGTTSVHLS